MKPKKKIAIVGTGISGLALHYYLKKGLREKDISAELTVIEPSSRPGGVIWTENKDAFTLEHGPDCFLSEKPAGLALVKELNLESELIQTQPEFRKSYIYQKKQLYGVPEGLYLMAPTKMVPFLFSPLMSLPGKARALMEPWIAKKIFASGEIEDESLSSFVRRRFGQEMLDKIAQPMIAGIYTADPETLSLKATMPRFLDLEKKYGSVIKGLLQGTLQKGTSGPRYSLFVSFKQGMATLPLKLQAEIDPGSLLQNITIDSISPQANHAWKITTNQKTIEADLLCLCTPSHTVATLLPTFKPIQDILSTIDYASAAILHFAYEKSQVKKPFHGMGFVVPHLEKKKIMACSFSSNKFKNRAPDSFHLIRVFCGGKLNESLLELDDTQLAAEVETELKELLNINGSPQFKTLRRWNKRMPQYRVGHVEKVKQLKAELDKHPSLFLSGNYFNGVGIPDVIQTAKDTANQILTTF